ncbi:leucine-rich repeat domain-containing protein [Paraburkholderia agricolaris]|uniref:leucine-rich repeat domain-containing protein n=1 Tax=Paraburkholderia agricolaris TaxID=2152888 RepID=UPI00142EFD11|nr:leucine-rich repeat domain-containing protein [Paraburkholderia agricolaris]
MNKSIEGTRNGSVISIGTQYSEAQKSGFVVRAAKHFHNAFNQILPPSSRGNTDQVPLRASAKAPIERINLKLADWERASPDSEAVSGASKEIRDFVRTVESLGEVGEIKLKLRLAKLGLEEAPPVLPDLQDLCEQHGVVLDELDLSGNKLTVLPESVGKLRALTSLSLSGNRFTEIPSPVKNLSALQTLQAFENNIQSVPDWLPELGNLRFLLLAANSITKIPASLLRCENLTVVTFDFNPIKEGQEVISKLRKRQIETADGHASMLGQRIRT